MTKETLAAGNALAAAIDKLDKEIEQINRTSNPPEIEVYAANGTGRVLFATIGTEDRCEHPDAKAAREFRSALTQRRQKEREVLRAKLAEL